MREILLHGTVSNFSVDHCIFEKKNIHEYFMKKSNKK